MITKKCINSHIAQNICINRKCEENAFICNNSECYVMNLHKNCRIITLVELDELNENNYTSHISKIEQIYQNMIKQINIDYSNFKEWIQQQKGRYKNINGQNDTNIITGAQVCKFIDIFTICTAEYSLSMMSDLEEIQRCLAENLINLKKIYTKTRQKIEDDTYFNGNITCKITSAVVWNQGEIKSLFKIINSDNKIKEIKNMYRASSNNFSVEKFHTICDGIPNTLVLLKNSKGRIHGGFTPLCWSSHDFGQYKADLSEKSYIFSLNREQKYQLFENQYAIECNKCCGPIFGRGAALWIYDQANTNSAYWYALPSSYHPANSEWTEDTFQQFIGAKMYENITLVEWEVFQIIFQ